MDDAFAISKEVTETGVGSIAFSSNWLVQISTHPLEALAKKHISTRTLFILIVFLAFWGREQLGEQQHSCVDVGFI